MALYSGGNPACELYNLWAASLMLVELPEPTQPAPDYRYPWNVSRPNGVWYGAPAAQRGGVIAWTAHASPRGHQAITLGIHYPRWDHTVPMLVVTSAGDFLLNPSYRIDNRLWLTGGSFLAYGYYDSSRRGWLVDMAHERQGGRDLKDWENPVPYVSEHLFRNYCPWWRLVPTEQGSWAIAPAVGMADSAFLADAERRERRYRKFRRVHEKDQPKPPAEPASHDVQQIVALLETTSSARRAVPMNRRPVEAQRGI